MKTYYLIIITSLFTINNYAQKDDFEAYKKQQEKEFKEYAQIQDSLFTAYVREEQERYNVYKSIDEISDEIKKNIESIERVFPKELSKITIKESENEIKNANLKESNKLKNKELVINSKPVKIKINNKKEVPTIIINKTIIPKESNAKNELAFEIAANRPVFFPLPNNSYRISSNFKKKRKHPILKKIRKHEGIDLAAPKGTKVYASANATVTISRLSKSAGNFIILNHNNGYTTTFMHLKKRYINKNDKVKRGQLIGEVGSTGYSTGPHLHYEIRKNGDAYDPASFMIKHF